MNLKEFMMFTTIIGYCSGAVHFSNPDEYRVGAGDTAVITCTTDSPWIWMDKLVNVVRYGKVTRFLRPESAIIRWDELVSIDPRTSLATTVDDTKTRWDVTISDVVPSDSGIYSCVEQIYIPTFMRLTADSQKTIKLVVS